MPNSVYHSSCSSTATTGPVVVLQRALGVHLQVRSANALHATVSIKVFCAPNIFRTPSGIFGIIFNVLRNQLTISGEYNMFLRTKLPLQNSLRRLVA